MSDNSKPVASGGIGFFGLLTVLFIALKLTGVINWSWWWVLAPWWGSVAIWLAVIVVFLVIAALVALFKR